MARKINESPWIKTQKVEHPLAFKAYKNFLKLKGEQGYFTPEYVFDHILKCKESVKKYAKEAAQVTLDDKVFESCELLEKALRNVLYYHQKRLEPKPLGKPQVVKMFQQLDILQEEALKKERLLRAQRIKKEREEAALKQTKRKNYFLEGISLDAFGEIKRSFLSAA
jgi:hypothetical protein